MTVGDPSGIGPEIAVAATRDPELTAAADVRLFGPHDDAELAAYPVGQVSAASGRAAYEAIVAGVDAARRGEADAVVTAPINKAAFAAAGLPWRGHTELIAHLTGASSVAMMFWSEPLRVVLATVHVPLAAVPAALTEARLLEVIRLTAGGLPDFGIAAPRIAVAGLNPHAGEGGLLGDEEQRVMAPAIAQACADGLAVSGPWPGDTVFARAIAGEFDVVVAAYHDQGLAPVKVAAFGRAVNVTLGLPIVRTSVDHGTAFDIARTGRANPSSLILAAQLAARLAAARRGRHA